MKRKRVNIAAPSDGCGRGDVFLRPCLLLNNYVCILKANQTLRFTGYLEFLAVHGSLEIFGQKFIDDEKFLSIWTFGCSSAAVGPTLTFKNVSKNLRNHSLLRLKLQKFCSSSVIDSCCQEFSSGSVCFLLRSLSACHLRLTSRIYPSLFDAPVEETTPVSSNERGNPTSFKLLKPSCSNNLCEFKNFVHADDVLSKISFHDGTAATKHPIIVVTGSKGCGKSTFCRYLANQLHASLPISPDGAVYFLDCDIGQSEFSLSGTVNLFHVERVALGPPFSHLTDPVMSYYIGDVTPSENPDRYLECIGLLMSKYRDECGGHCSPLVVNCHGWNQGFGEILLSETLKQVNPNFVVTIRFPEENACNILAVANAEIIDICSPLSSTFKPIGDRLSNRSIRELSLLSYFGKCLTSHSSLLNSVRPLAVSWDKIAVALTSNKDVGPVVQDSKIMCVLNGCFVALCSVNEDNFVGRYCNNSAMPFKLKASTPLLCRGFGIIRAIDVINKLLYVITPMTVVDLKDVNCIAKGTVELPPSLFSLQLDGLGVTCEILPYMELAASQVDHLPKSTAKRLKSAMKFKTKQMKRQYTE